MKIVPCASSRWDARWTRKASTIFSPRSPVSGRSSAGGLTHVGGGPMLRELQAIARRLGIDDRIEWRGAQAQEAVLDAYRAPTSSRCPCRVSDDGDRDGLPNVLLEAQSQKLPCVSTRISGIPELIEHEQTGLLVEPGRLPPCRRRSRG
jgi:glycosyltransferase involved in cell wall biosynthesis